jgi:hypothetical protein
VSNYISASLLCIQYESLSIFSTLAIIYDNRRYEMVWRGPGIPLGVCDWIAQGVCRVDGGKSREAIYR